LASVARLVPRGIRDWGYDLVARHRHRLAVDGAACVIPTEEERERFID
jgi:predicted DCC family thiol-disulfide oxidoreductase YuxK